MDFNFQKGINQAPIISDWLGTDYGKQIQDQLAQNQQIYGGMQTPQFNPYIPEAYTVAGTYDPQMAEATSIQQNPELTSMQLSNLNRLAGLSTTGLSDVDQAGYERARNIGNEVLRGGTEAALQNAEARGQAGTGSELAMREMAAQQGSQNANNSALQQAADAAKMRALYTQAFGGAAAGLNSQQFGQNAANANILNQFNMANTQAKNQGNLYNLGVAQSTSDKNVAAENAAQQYNNTMQQQSFQDQMAKAGGMAGANSGYAQGLAAQDAANQSQRNAYMNTAATLAGSAMSKGGGAAMMA